MHTRMMATMAAALLAACGTVTADVFNMGSGLTSLDTVPVGNAGNAPDTRYNPTGYGGVGYTYNVGKYEVTSGQYTEFLNAVAATDSYGLYSPLMANPTVTNGANIQRSGSPGSYTYSVAADWANRPVNYVSWGDAARFANWLHNGQPEGLQGLFTTEDGSYFLNGATGNAALLAVTREPDATWVIPTRDEWHKAAYHQNDGVTGNYWDYPIRTNAFPGNGNPGGDTGNSANFYDAGYTIGNPYYRTEVGFFGLSDSPYGTFDQGGNIWEWTEEVILESYRGLQGGAYAYNYGNLHAASGQGYAPTNEIDGFGFRVAMVPEPATLGLLTFGGLVLVRRRRTLR